MIIGIALILNGLRRAAGSQSTAGLTLRWVIIAFYAAALIVVVILWRRQVRSRRR